jgi:hypothetical protein
VCSEGCTYTLESPLVFQLYGCLWLVELQARQGLVQPWAKLSLGRMPGQCRL